MPEPTPDWVMEPKREPNVWDELSRKLKSGELAPDGPAARMLERHHPELLPPEDDEEEHDA